MMVDHHAEIGLPVGTLLRAKEHHPVRSYAKGDGLAVIVTPVGGDFQTLYWVNGDPRTPVRYDNTAIAHTLLWFDVIPDDQRANYLPAEFVLPPGAARRCSSAWLRIFDCMFLGSHQYDKD